MNNVPPPPQTSDILTLILSSKNATDGTPAAAASEQHGMFEYIGPKQGYLGTGFSFATVHALGVVEDHPAVMRYNALKHWAAQAYPTRGSRPAWVNDEMTRLSGHASRAKRAQTPDQELAYSARHMAREQAWFACRGQWPAELPELPFVGSPRGRTKRAIMKSTKRAVLRPALSWRDQAERDLAVLHELGHVVPRSTRPIQTWWQSRGNHLGNELQAVPLPIAYHSWLSCSGRYNGKHCPHCIKDGHHRSKRAMSAGRLELPGDIP
jgi:hypothetical protein